MPSSPSGPGSKSGAPPKRDGAATPKASGEVYFEFIPAGAYVRVVAIDADTGTEVTVVGDANASQAILERTALAKLAYVLKKPR